MSIKKPQLIFYFFIAFAFLVYKFVDKSELQKDELKKRAFSSIHVSKFSSHGVVDRVINLKIETKDLSEGQTEVVAHINIPFTVEKPLSFKWVLGSGVVLKAGDLSGTIINPPANENFSQSIFVNGYTASQLRHIKFEIIGEKGPRKIFGEGLISSQAEQSFEKFVQKTEAEKNSEKQNFKKQIHRYPTSPKNQHQ